MMPRMLRVEWKNCSGASKQKKILHLKPNSEGVYDCPIDVCLHSGFKSQRGLRKHINNQHTWFYYFDQRPDLKRADAVASAQIRPTKRRPTKLTLQIGLQADFLEWLSSPCGAGKTETDARNTAIRALKFLDHCFDDEYDKLTTDLSVDYCLGSPSLILSFCKSITEEWEYSSSCALSYIKAIEDLLDFRKCKGVSDAVLRTFASSEVYIRRAKTNFGKRKAVEYKRSLDLESLIVKESWATLEEMEQVIPYHTSRFMYICKQYSDVGKNSVTGDLAFATRFLITFMFLRIKGTRPMTFQFLTVAMFEQSKKDNGFIDQTKFKTEGQYLFDTLILTPAVTSIMQSYLDFIRPRCTPKCEYVLVNSKGNQYQNLHYAMTLLVYEAIGKHINPTRLRQMIETESLTKLSPAEQAVVSEDQKHSSNTAKRFYKKVRSRDVAEKGKEAMNKLRSAEGEKHTETISKELASLSPSVEMPRSVEEDDVKQLVTEPAQSIDEEDVMVDSTEVECITPIEELVIAVASDKDESEKPSPGKPATRGRMKEVEVKREEVDDYLRGNKVVRFTDEEDGYLSSGIKKFGSSNWSKILKCPEYSFHPSRTRDSLRMRSKSRNLVKVKKK